MKAYVIIDIQNDITKNYKLVIDRINEGISWAKENGMEIVYIKHHIDLPYAKTFQLGTKGFELVPELNIASNNIFVKTKANSLTCEEFVKFINEKQIDEFYITGGDATGCVKSTSMNMSKAGYKVNVIKDCITCYNLEKLKEMFKYYESKNCNVKNLCEYK